MSSEQETHLKQALLCGGSSEMYLYWDLLSNIIEATAGGKTTVRMLQFLYLPLIIRALLKLRAPFIELFLS